MSPATYTWMQQLGLPMRQMDSDGRRIVVSRR